MKHSCDWRGGNTCRADATRRVERTYDDRTSLVTYECEEHSDQQSNPGVVFAVSRPLKKVS